jgi:hypothetical protein
VRIEEGGHAREVELEGRAARELRNAAYEFAGEFGVELPS